MAKFVVVKAFNRGVLDDSEPTSINIDQITHFYERSQVMPNDESRPVVHCDINSKGWLLIDCSMAEFVELLRTVAS